MPSYTKMNASHILEILEDSSTRLDCDTKCYGPIATVSCQKVLGPWREDEELSWKEDSGTRQ